MGEISRKYCGLCGAEVEFVANEIDLKERAVQGHEAIVEATYGVFATCFEKLKKRLDEAQAAVDIKWTLKAPTKLTVEL